MGFEAVPLLFHYLANSLIDDPPCVARYSFEPLDLTEIRLGAMAGNPTKTAHGSLRTNPVP